MPLSLSEALGQANGLNTNTSDASNVFIIRQAKLDQIPRIFKADLSSPSGFIDAGNFYLNDNDIIYVNAKKVQQDGIESFHNFFPFSSFLNSINNLTSE